MKIVLQIFLSFIVGFLAGYLVNLSANDEIKNKLEIEVKLSQRRLQTVYYTSSLIQLRGYNFDNIKNKQTSPYSKLAYCFSQSLRALETARKLAAENEVYRGYADQIFEHCNSMAFLLNGILTDENRPEEDWTTERWAELISKQKKLYLNIAKKPSDNPVLISLP